MTAKTAYLVEYPESNYSLQLFGGFNPSGPTQHSYSANMFLYMIEICHIYHPQHVFMLSTDDTCSRLSPHSAIMSMSSGSSTTTSRICDLFIVTLASMKMPTHETLVPNPTPWQTSKLWHVKRHWVSLKCYLWVVVRRFLGYTYREHINE